MRSVVISPPRLDAARGCSVGADVEAIRPSNTIGVNDAQYQPHWPISEMLVAPFASPNRRSAGISKSVTAPAAAVGPAALRSGGFAPLTILFIPPRILIISVLCFADANNERDCAGAALDRPQRRRGGSKLISAERRSELRTIRHRPQSRAWLLSL